MEKRHRSFDAVGDIALVRLPDTVGSRMKKRVALEIMSMNKNIKSVYNRVGKTSGEERVAKLRYVSGRRGTVTVHRENGCLFYVDVRRVYFSPRLSNERARITGQIKTGENILDMFCGVGPYTIEASKKAGSVYAIDKNRKAIDLLKKNVKINKAYNVEYACGDARRIVPKLDGEFDRIIMNFPMDAKSFLKQALGSAAKRAVVHLYAFAKRGGEDELAVKKMIRSYSDRDLTVTSIKSYRTGEVAPFVDRLCFDIRVRRKPHSAR